MDQIRRLFSGFSPVQRVTIGLAAAAVIALLMLVTHWTHEHDFQPLYTGLAAEDAAAVVEKVHESGTEYRLAENGSTVLVPSAKVAEMRLQLAAAGIPRTGRIGYELFDKTNFGATDFTEQVNYHRALEGELERSIMGLTEVEQARVHITFAKDSVFTENQQPAKASVLVKLRPGARLSPQNVLAICHLTASAVDQLQPEAVSVLDMQGNLLSRPHRPSLPDSPGPSDEALEYRQSIERDLLSKINSTLETPAGARPLPRRCLGGLRLHQRRAKRGELRSVEVGDGEFTENRRRQHRRHHIRAARHSLEPSASAGPGEWHHQQRQPPHRKHFVPDQPDR